MKYFFYLSVFLLHVPFAFSSLSMENQLSDHEEVDDLIIEEPAYSGSESYPSAHQASQDITIAEAVAEDGATARVIAKNSIRVQNSVCFLYGKGFRPNENLTVASTSCDEPLSFEVVAPTSCGKTLSFEVQADSKGEFFATLSVEEIIGFGQPGGVCYVAILREFVDAPLHLRYPWGVEAIFNYPWSY